MASDLFELTWYINLKQIGISHFRKQSLFAKNRISCILNDLGMKHETYNYQITHLTLGTSKCYEDDLVRLLLRLPWSSFRVYDNSVGIAFSDQAAGWCDMLC